MPWGFAMLVITRDGSKRRRLRALWVSSGLGNITETRFPRFPPISPRLISVCSAPGCASRRRSSGRRSALSMSYWSGLLRPYARFNVVASPQLWLFLINPADIRLRTEAT